MFTALLGGEARVPTLAGPVALRMPAGTQSGRTFRLTGQGMPKLRSDQRGDLYAKVRITLPDKLSEREMQLVREWAQLRGVIASGLMAAGHQPVYIAPVHLHRGIVRRTSLTYARFRSVDDDARTGSS